MKTLDKGIIRNKTGEPSSGLLEDSELRQKLEELGLSIGQFKDKVIETAGLVCQIIDGYKGDGIGLILTRYPDLSRSAIERLEAIGRGRLLPQFALDSSPAARYIVDLPAATQSIILRDGVELLKVSGVIRKPYQQLTYAECTQVFGNGKLRSIKEQEKAMEQEAKPKYKQRYEIDPVLGVVIFHEDCQFNVLELENLLEKLKQIELKNLQDNLKKKQVRG